MRIPRTHPRQDLIRYCRYSIAAIKSDPEVASLVVQLMVLFTKLLEALAERNNADDSCLEHEAVCDYQLRRTGSVLKSLSNVALGCLGNSRDNAQYRQLFETRPTEILRNTDRQERVKSIRKIAQTGAADSMPEAVRAIAATLGQQCAGLEAAEQGLADYRAVFETRRAEEEAAAEALVIGIKRLAAQLTDRFPDDRARVDGYFPFVSTKRNGKGEEAEEQKSAPSKPEEKATPTP